MSLPPPEVAAAVLITAIGGAALLAALIAVDRLLGVIARRLDSLHEGLGAIDAATEPLTDRVAGIAANVAKLKVAAADFNLVLAGRVHAHRQPRAGAESPR